MCVISIWITFLTVTCVSVLSHPELISHLPTAFLFCLWFSVTHGATLVFYPPPLHLSEAYSSYCTVSYNHLHLCISLYLCEFLQFVIMRSYLYCYLSLGLNGPLGAPLCHGTKFCLFVYLFSGSISATNAFQHCSFPLRLVPILHLVE